MKKYIRTIHSVVGTAALLMGTAAALTACSSDNEDITTPATRTLTLNCGIEATDSKAESRAGVIYGGTDESKETFIWHAGDKFEAWLKNAGGTNFEETVPKFSIATDYSDDDPSGTASFTCTKFPDDRDYDFVAVYPQGVFTNSQGFLVSKGLQTDQVQMGKSTNHLKDVMFMYATGSVTKGNTPSSLTFHHITSLLRFTVKNENDQPCKLKEISVTAGADVFGIEWEFGYANGSIELLTDINASSLTLIFGDIPELASNNQFDGYMLTGPVTYNAAPLTDKTLTFTLTVTDADGTNERIYTSMALNANKIVDANKGATTWEAGKRYWFDLTLKEKLTVSLVTVDTALPGWSTEDETDIQ